jgi:hypothetical protein
MYEDGRSHGCIGGIGEREHSTTKLRLDVSNRDIGARRTKTFFSCITTSLNCYH